MRRTTQTAPKKRKPKSKIKLKSTQTSAGSRLGSMYDKMIKENLKKSIKTIIQSVDGFKIIKFEPLRTKLQHTKERDPDEISRIWLADGSEQILHAEDRLKKLAKTHAEKEKYYAQLRILSNVRKLQPIIDKVMANIFKLIDISEDPLYVKGIKEGEEKGELRGELKGELRGELKGKIKGIESLIISTEFDDAYIALLMAVPVQLVTETRVHLLTEQKKIDANKK